MAGAGQAAREASGGGEEAQHCAERAWAKTMVGCWEGCEDGCLEVCWKAEELAFAKVVLVDSTVAKTDSKAWREKRQQPRALRQTDAGFASSRGSLDISPLIRRT